MVGARIGVINMFHILMGFELHVCTFKTQEGIVKICVFHCLQILLKNIIHTQINIELQFIILMLKCLWVKYFNSATCFKISFP